VIQSFETQRADAAAGRADAALAGAIQMGGQGDSEAAGKRKQGGDAATAAVQTGPDPVTSELTGRRHPDSAANESAPAGVGAPRTRHPAAALQRRIAEHWQRQLFSDLAGAVRGGGDDDDVGFLTTRPRVFRVPGAELRLLEVALRAQEDAVGEALAAAFDDEDEGEDDDDDVESGDESEAGSARDRDVRPRRSAVPPLIASSGRAAAPLAHTLSSRPPRTSPRQGTSARSALQSLTGLGAAAVEVSTFRVVTESESDVGGAGGVLPLSASGQGLDLRETDTGRASLASAWNGSQASLAQLQ